MAEYPMDRRARAAKRKEIRDAHLARAERIAAASGRSIKCGHYQQHADQEGGCANDGSNCLCECHDLKEPADA
jgi:hypothetical protein